MCASVLGRGPEDMKRAWKKMSQSGLLRKVFDSDAPVCGVGDKKLQGDS